MIQGTPSCFSWVFLVILKVKLQYICLENYVKYGIIYCRKNRKETQKNERVSEKE